MFSRRAFSGRSHNLQVVARVAALAMTALVCACDQSQSSSSFACPEPGTLYTLSMPLDMSADPQFRTRVLVLGQNGYECHILDDASNNTSLYAGIVARNEAKAWQAAAEALWPLKVGNSTHAHFVGRGSDVWSIDYQVVDFRKFTARVGTFRAYEIVGTLRLNGKAFSTATVWWAPDLSFTLSYRWARVDGTRSRHWEIASLGVDRDQ